MIRALKEDVIERLKMKRLSFSKSQLKTSHPGDKVSSSSQPPMLNVQSQMIPDGQGKMAAGSVKVTADLSHKSILEMLERFERTSPQALNVFIESAQKKGLYSSVKDGTEFRKKTKSVFTKSIDFSQR
jgi:hypothetical protein